MQLEMSPTQCRPFYSGLVGINTLRPRQNGRRFADDTFKRIFLNENVRISIEISLKFVPKGPINNIPALVQIMAWRRSGDKPLSKPMMIRSPTHIWVTRPQWVNHITCAKIKYSRSWNSGRRRVDGLGQDCRISSVVAMEILQSCT